MDMGRNSEHYSDPTPGTAWENMRREEKRLDAARLVMVSALVPILRQTAELAGFDRPHTAARQGDREGVQIKMEGFDFFGLAAKESREPETRELPRRILFRGKLKSGEWASGNLNVDSKGICIIRPGKNVVGKYGRVNPETVGQATGILDKRARDIFEGDILKIHHKTPLPVGLAVVKYDKKQSAFRAFPVDRPWYACQIAYPDEIVGNIYDNPDLLKQGEDTQK